MDVQLSVVFQPWMDVLFPTKLSPPAPQPSLCPPCQARPSFNWMGALLAEARRLIDSFTARELAALLWACTSIGHVPDQLFMEVWFRCESVNRVKQ